MFSSPAHRASAHSSGHRATGGPAPAPAAATAVLHTPLRYVASRPHSCTAAPLLQSSLRPRQPARQPRTAVAAVAGNGAGNAAAQAPPVRYVLKNGMVDYYEVLQVDDDAPRKEIKQAYRAATKMCHPDFLGEEGHNICVLLNEAYEVLSDEEQRIVYNGKLEEALKDEEDDYTGQPLSKWIPTRVPRRARNEDPNERRAVFVDEFSCIGCKQCIYQAPATFRIEPVHGRSRVFAQWLEPEENNQAAIDSCPVDCIHWVDKDDLPALEYVMQKRMTQRTNVGIMMAGQGASADVFQATEQFKKERRRMKEAQEAASRKRPYSPAQEDARKRAAEALKKKNFFTGFSMGDMFASMMSQVNSTVQGPPEANVRVGHRKRALRWDQVYGRPGSRDSPSSSLSSIDDSLSSVSSVDSLDWDGVLSYNEEYVEIPAERALVPVGKD